MSLPSDLQPHFHEPQQLSKNIFLKTIFESNLLSLVKVGLDLGCSLFARRYLGNVSACADLFFIPPLNKMFQFSGCALSFKDESRCGLRTGVSSFGDLRIIGCSTPPRSLSQLRHVLHRCYVPRHPPYALTFSLFSENAINRPSERSSRFHGQIYFTFY